MKWPRTPSGKRTARALALAAVALAALDILLEEEDPSLAGRRELASSPARLDDTTSARPDDNNRLCIATVNDGKISTSSIADADGKYALALPEGYATTAKIECTLTDQTTGKMTVESRREEAVRGRDASKPAVGETARHLEEDGGCEGVSFRPGYFDHGTGTWHDHCTDFASHTREGASAPLAPAKCPAATAQPDLWVHFVGDSVTRGLVQAGLRKAGIDMTLARQWTTGRNANLPDAILGEFGNKEHRVWFSYAFDFMHGGAEMMYPLVRTWGEFLARRSTPGKEVRKKGGLKLGSAKNVKGDPDFPPDRAPDIVFWSPGYHASKASADEFGAGMEAILTEWKDAMDEIGAPMPRMHIPLNFMPAYWMIPRHHSDDIPHRTLLNEHRKNLAILAVAKKFDFVQGVVDWNSVELPFNGSPGRPSAHGDAVHIHDRAVLRVTGDQVIDALCHTRLDPRQVGS